MPRHPPCAFSRLIPCSSDIALASHEQLGALSLIGPPSHSKLLRFLYACYHFLWNCFPYCQSAAGSLGAALASCKTWRCTCLMPWFANRVAVQKDRGLLLKGGNPAAPSGTATLLRLSPSQRSCFRRWLPCGLASRLRALPSSMA